MINYKIKQILKDIYDENQYQIVKIHPQIFTKNVM